MTLSRRERPIALSEKQYILGRREKTIGGILNIGRYYALDGSLGAPVFLDVLRPHVIFICGKRGYGKSYTIGVILEEIAALDNKVKENLGILVLDTLGIFWTSQFPCHDHEEQFIHWGKKPQGIKIRLVVPAHAMQEYMKNGLDVKCFLLRTADLSPLYWCQLFDVKPIDAVGILITKTILALQGLSVNFTIDDIMHCLKEDTKADSSVVYAAENFFIQAKSWGIFGKEGLSIESLVQRAKITILDLSHLPHPVLKDVVVALVAEKIFEERVKERKNYEKKQIGLIVESRGMPQVWLAVDEAQVFVPYGKKTVSKDILIDGWMRQGRQPGLSLLLATQRPSAIEPEVLSHSDILVCHRLTAQEDIDALSRIRPTFMHGDISESIKKIGIEKGVAFLVDDTSESAHVIKVRPRLSWHGGSEPIVSKS